MEKKSEAEILPNRILLKAKHFIIYAMCEIEFHDQEFRKMKSNSTC